MTSSMITLVDSSETSVAALLEAWKDNTKSLMLILGEGSSHEVITKIAENMMLTSPTTRSVIWIKDIKLLGYVNFKDNINNSVSLLFDFNRVLSKRFDSASAQNNREVDEAFAVIEENS